MTAELPHTTVLPVLLALFLTCFVALVAATVLLLAFGDRVRVANRALGLVAGVALAVGAGQAAARPNVQVVECARANFDQNFVGACARLGALLGAQDFRPPVLVEDDCSHVLDFRFLIGECKGRGK